MPGIFRNSLLGNVTFRWVLIVYTLLGIILWPIPVFNILHAESTAVVALVAFFAAGLASLRLFIQRHPFRNVLLWQEAALIVPWFLLTVTLFWAPNCAYLVGSGFFLLFPVVSTVFAVALAFAISRTRIRRKRLLLVITGLAIAICTPVYDLLFHPQFFVYNHVFGGVLGPIYDEDLSIRPGLFFFRVLTLLWAFLLYSAGRYVERRREGEQRSLHALPRRDSRWAVRGAVAALIIGIMYAFSARLGFNTPSWYTKSVLGGKILTEHFKIYYDPDAVTPEQLQFLAEDHEFQYSRLSELLEIEIPGRIESFIYPDPETKAQLTGARYTNIAPVWLRVPQVHILLDTYEAVFSHELVHVFSREFGLPVINASVSAGMIEGLAVALEAPDGRPSPHEQVIVVALGGRISGIEDIDLGVDLASRLSPLGFWTGRGAVSYTTMGSFVRYLYEAYGAEAIKAVYATADFEGVYQKPVEVLTKEWQNYLLGLPVVTASSEVYAVRRFAIPSLFEKRCPHYVPPYVRLYEDALQAYAEGDTAGAYGYLERALKKQPNYSPALLLWGSIKLARNFPAEVLARLDSLGMTSRTASLALLAGDANVLLSRTETARTLYETALSQLPLYAGESRAIVVLRTLLADNPEVTRILVSGDPAEEQVERLAEIRDADPLVTAVHALMLASARRYEQAANLLQKVTFEKIDVPGLDRLEALQRQRLAWLASFYYRSNNLETAEIFADQARRAYYLAGDVNQAAFFQYFAFKMQWLERYPVSFAVIRGS